MIKKILIGFCTVLALAGLGIYLILPPVNVPLGLFSGGIKADELSLAERIILPEGFQFTVFAKDLKGVRMMQVTSNGDVVATTPRAGQVHLIHKDANGDGVSDNSEVILSDLNRPHGVELFEGWLYIAEIDAVGRIRFDPMARETSGSYEQIVTGLPDDGGHWTRTIRAGTDGWLYVSVGSSCNVCIETDARRAAVLRISPDGKEQTLYATGLRNSVGMDWSPRDGGLYATDNGRDMLGDDFPPEELNLVVKDGFYGWPFINAYGDLDPDHGEGNETRLTDNIDPVHGFRPHNAPLGIRFLQFGNYPDTYHHDALVALHGSWNRSEKDGYKVVRLHWSDNDSITESDFMTGFLINGDVIGRPVDIAESPSGEIFISDDFNGSIYRVVYSGQ